MDPIGIALCGLGIALVIGSQGVFEIRDYVLLGAAFYGMHRLLRSRGPLWLIGALVVVWGLDHFWMFVPTLLVKNSSEFANTHPTLQATPAWLAHVTMTGIFAASVILARRRIGVGLVTLTLAALGMVLFSEIGLRLADEKESSAHILFEAMSRGWGHVWFGLIATSWFALAVGPLLVASPPRRLGASIGAVGAALLCAVIAGAPDHVSGSHEGVVFFTTAAMALGWVLCAVGLGGLARAGAGAAGWMGMGLAIFQVLLLPIGLALDDNVGDVSDGLNAVLFFGFVGLGVAAISAPSLGLGKVRAVAAALFLVAAFGSGLASVAIFASAKRILHIDRPFWAVRTFMQPAAMMGLLVWAACLAYLVRPPAPAPTPPA